MTKIIPIVVNLRCESYSDETGIGCVKWVAGGVCFERNVSRFSSSFDSILADVCYRSGYMTKSFYVPKGKFNAVQNQYQIFKWDEKNKKDVLVCIVPLSQLPKR